MAETKKEEIKLTKEELQTLIGVVGQVSVPISSKEHETAIGLINKLSKMVGEVK